jgi:hypothetical protein
VSHSITPFGLRHPLQRYGKEMGFAPRLIF